jgi:hypothetical protein
VGTGTSGVGDIVGAVVGDLICAKRKSMYRRFSG